MLKTKDDFSKGAKVTQDNQIFAGGGKSKSERTNQSNSGSSNGSQNTK
ncbi:hypothetical protein [Bacillus sp. V5-8f]|nr:hypothetical protein [Bacillus sp. V5-8f]